MGENDILRLKLRILCVSSHKSLRLNERFLQLTYAEFIAELDQAAMSVREFALLMQMNPNSVSNYARSGEVPPHLAVIAALLAELHKSGIDHRPVFSRIQITPKRPRGSAERGRFGGDPQRRLGL